MFVLYIYFLSFQLPPTFSTFFFFYFFLLPGAVYHLLIELGIILIQLHPGPLDDWSIQTAVHRKTLKSLETTLLDSQCCKISSFGTPKAFIKKQLLYLSTVT